MGRKHGLESWLIAFHHERSQLLPVYLTLSSNVPCQESLQDLGIYKGEDTHHSRPLLCISPVSSCVVPASFVPSAPDNLSLLQRAIFSKILVFCPTCFIIFTPDHFYSVFSIHLLLPVCHLLTDFGSSINYLKRL